MTTESDTTFVYYSIDKINFLLIQVQTSIIKIQN